MSQESPDNPDVNDRSVSNTVALIGVILLGVAVALCVLLFVLLSHLPDNVEEVRQLTATGPAQLRLLILVCATGVLNVVAFLLCAVGLIVPDRPRLLATIGTLVSLTMLLFFFGALAAGTALNSVLVDKHGSTAEAIATP